MWKLTIVQKRKSESSDYVFEEAIEFISDDMGELLNLVERLSRLDTTRKTSYKVEKAEEGKEE